MPGAARSLTVAGWRRARCGRAANRVGAWPSRSITASANRCVATAEPGAATSAVATRCSSAASSAFSTRNASASSSRWRSIITADSTTADGFAMSLPAIVGALPCTASKIATSAPMFATSAPMFAPGAKPRPPTRPDVRSDRMSPFMLDVTITSNASGVRTSWCAQASTRIVRGSICGYSLATSSKVRFSRPSVRFMMLALVAHVTLLRPSATATSNASRTIFSQPLRLISLRHWATPGVCWCSIPAYRSSTFSRTTIRSIPRPLNGVATPGSSRIGRRLP